MKFLEVAFLSILLLFSQAVFALTPPDFCVSKAWDTDKVYMNGDLAVHNQREWKALWWQKGTAPGENVAGWELVAICDLIPPTVSITAPANNTVFQQGSNVEFTMEAADADGTVASVTLETGDVMMAIPLGSTTQAPYSIVWENVPAGSHRVFAFAIDNEGNKTYSETITILVDEVIPGSKITSPTDGGVYSVGKLLNIRVETTGLGNVDHVKFYLNGNFSGTSHTQPYGYGWIPSEPGKHTLYAEAITTDGVVYKTQTVNFEFVVSCGDEWNPDRVYTRWDQAVYNNVLYEAQWWNQEVPGTGSAWRRIKDCQ